jgi:hypothetical protein
VNDMNVPARGASAGDGEALWRTDPGLVSPESIGHLDAIVQLAGENLPEAGFVFLDQSLEATLYRLLGGSAERQAGTERWASRMP